VQTSHKSYLYYLLSRREYSRFELLQKLKQRQVSEEESNILLDELITSGWQSDERFAECFCRAQLSKLRGSNRIYQAIMQKGIDKDTYEATLSELEVNWSQVARDCYVKKYRVYEPEEALPFDVQQKRIKYLIAQGFGFDVSKEVVG
jgi:regulatory protein